MKKHLHQRTEDNGSDDQDNTGLSRKKKVKNNNSETEADSCFVARVTASNLHNDALPLPQNFTSSIGLKRKCRKIVLTDGGERSCALDLRFNKSSDTFYITQGWRNFCDENGKKAGSFFMFKLMKNGEMPLLSFYPAESRGEKASKKESLPVEPSSCKQISKEERKKSHLRCRDSTSPIENRFVTLTLTHDSLRNSRLHLPLPFIRENGFDKPRLITLLGKDGTKRAADLRRENANGRMRLAKGWKDFAKGNGLKTGESYTLESIWKDKTPMLALLHTDPSIGKRQQGECCSKAREKESVSIELTSGGKTRKAKNTIEVRSLRELRRNKCLPNRRDSLSPVQNRFVILTLVPEDVKTCKLHLPSQFIRDNGIDKLGKITMLGKDDGMKCSAYLLSRDGFLALGIDWKGFCEANGVKTGESFTLEFINEQYKTTPVLKFCSNCGD